MRRCIYTHLLTVPGDHLRSVIRELHLGSGAALHHLQVLERSGLIRRENGGARTRYYPVRDETQRRVNEEYRQRWAQRDMRRRLEDAVARLDEVRPATVARALGISRQLAAYYLAKRAEDQRRNEAEVRSASASKSVPNRI